MNPPVFLVAMLLLLLVVLLPSISAALPRIHVDRATGHFMSMETKQRVILHGTNSVTKYPPFYSSFSDEEIDRFAYDWGFNVIRMGIEWIGIEPERGQHNYTYLQETKNLVKRFAERGVYTILDMHQDLYSPKICGNGAPDWAVVVDPVVEALAPFPMPVLGRTVFEYGEDGRISSEDCGKLPYWSFIYFTAVTGSAFQSLYDDARGIQQAFINTWQIVATEFAGMTEVIGLELLNEPWPGRIYTEPGLLLRPGYADAKHLAPMYEKIHQAVRAVDNDTIIFYEPHVSTSQVLPFSAGFEQGPGGAEYNDRQVFAFHHYCPTVDASGVPTNEIFCDWFAERSLEVRVVDSERLGGGSMLTEWGAFANNAGAIEEMNTISQLADKFLMSWAHWEYKVITGASLQDQLTFTYARKLAGLPVSMYHDIPTSTFTVIYSALVSTSGETEIYLNEDVHYSSAFSVEISPPGAARWDLMRKNFIVVSHASSVQDGDLITIQIKKL